MKEGTSFLLGRRFVLGASCEGAAGVAQWNVLADGLHDSFPRCNKSILEWKHREPLIAADIRAFLERGLVVACEEVDRFKELQRQLGAVALGFFQAKKGGVGDGCALFVPTAHYELLKTHESCVLEKGASQVALCVALTHRVSKMQFVVAATHFKAKRGFEELRRRQAVALCAFVEHYAAGLPICIAGDFNDEPNSMASDVMRAAGFQSAYVACGVGETYTTSKWREELTTRTIDYLWLKNLKPVDVLSIPDVKTLEPTHLPLPEYPSDHLSIASFLEEEKKTTKL